MKQTFTVTLDTEHDELSNLEIYIKAIDFKVAIEEFDQELRNKVKYTEEDTIKIDEVRALLREKLEVNGVTLY